MEGNSLRLRDLLFKAHVPAEMMLETYLRCKMCRGVVIVDGRMVPDRAARSGQVLWHELAKMNGKWGKRELGPHHGVRTLTELAASHIKSC